MEVSLLPFTSTEAFIGAGGNFHGRKQIDKVKIWWWKLSHYLFGFLSLGPWKFPSTSTNFHEGKLLPWKQMEASMEADRSASTETSIYFLPLKLPSSTEAFHGSRSTSTYLWTTWYDVYNKYQVIFPSTSINFHGSFHQLRWRQIYFSFLGSRPASMEVAPASMEEATNYFQTLPEVAPASMEATTYSHILSSTV